MRRLFDIISLWYKLLFTDSVVYSIQLCQFGPSQREENSEIYHIGKERVAIWYTASVFVCDSLLSYFSISHVNIYHGILYTLVLSGSHFWLVGSVSACSRVSL